jgi:dimethylglycine catabolism A
MSEQSGKNDPLLQPLRIRNLLLKNRIMSTSHASGLSENDMPLEKYQRYHEEKAIGGLALSMFGGSSIVSRDSSKVFAQLDLTDDRIVEHFQRFADRMHRHGAALMCQLTHLGRRGSPYVSDWVSTIAPSRVRETLHRSIPREMDKADISRVVRDFGLAAKRCEDGGLDGIETLAGGHLIGQFLSPLTNLRTDSYGGSIENRCRFAIEVHEEIRRSVGERFVAGIRYTIDEAFDGGMSFEEALRAAKLIEAEGVVDFFNVTYGRVDTSATLATDAMPGMFMKSAPWLKAAAAFKNEVSLPVFHAAKIADLATARYAVSEGLLDMVGMTRAHIADPHIVQKLVTGREDQIRPCVGASFCRSHQSACIHNPSTGREVLMPHDVPPSTAKKRVVVVGGGLAGLEAARVGALRGHDVSLFEASSQLGGQILLARKGSWRKDLIGIVDWRVGELARLGVNVRTDTYADAEMLRAEKPDVVVIATGGIPDPGNLKGGEYCISSFDALTMRTPNQGKAIVYDGTGRHVAAVCAEHYAMAGVKVELISLDRTFGEELEGRGDEIGWIRRFSELDVSMRHDLQLAEVELIESKRRRAWFTHQVTQERFHFDVDFIIIELGMRPVDDLFLELRAESINGGVIDHQSLIDGVPQRAAHPVAGAYELYRIGDAESSRNIHSAIYDAFRLLRAV